MLALLKTHTPRWIKRLIKDALGQYDHQADAQDIHNCYRLLLGRNPDADGLQFYKTHVRSGAMDVKQLVQAFIYSEEFRGRNLLHFQPIPAANPVLVTVENFQIYATPNDSGVGHLLLTDGSYEKHLTLYLKKALKPGSVFLDLGANIGYFSLLAARLVGPEGRVISVEPVPHNCNLLFLSALRNGFQNIDVIPAAAYDRACMFKFIDTGSNGYLKELPADIDADSAGGLLVRAVRLDQQLRDLDRLDVIKMDVEGAEYRAFLGALPLIRRFKPTIISEFSPPMLEKVSQVTGTSYLSLLSENGYEIAALDHDGNPVSFSDPITGVMRFFQSVGSTHIDLLARPR